MHVAQWAGSSRVRNRKQEVISQDDLNTLGCGVHQENNNRHTHRTWYCVCVCACKRRKRKALETDRGLWPDCAVLKLKNHNTHPFIYLYMCVCVKPRCHKLLLQCVFRHLQYHSQSPQNNASWKHHGTQVNFQSKGNAGSTWINDKKGVCWQCVVHFPAITLVD